MTGRCGVRYTVTDEQIREFRKLSPAEKLRRLEDLEDFLARAMTPRAKKIREMFRREEIRSPSACAEPPARLERLLTSPAAGRS